MKIKFKKEIILSLIVLFLISPVFVNAQAAGAYAAETARRVVGIPFGGPTFGIVQFCPCSPTQPTFVVLIFDYRTKLPLRLTFAPPFSKIYKWYNLVTPLTQTLGTFSLSGPPCLIYSGDSCKPVPVDGVIDFLPGVGTGAFPPVFGTN